MAEMKKAAVVAVEQGAYVKKNESVLIITDDSASAVAEALYSAVKDVGASVYLIRMPIMERDGQEPPKLIADIMKKFDVIFCPTKYSITHTKAVKNTFRNGTRVVTLPGINDDIFKRCLDVDYAKMKETADWLQKHLEKAEAAKITTPSGTDVSFRIAGRPVYPDLTLTKKGDSINLPSGEVFLAPIEGTAAGVIVIDHMADIAKPKTKVSVRNGLAQDVSGDDEFRKKLWGYRNARNVAEFGIGINPKARISGEILEDEKVMGTCHIAFGSNFDFGGRVNSDIHWDAILLKPTIWLDGKKIMDGGDLLM